MRKSSVSPLVKRQKCAQKGGAHVRKMWTNVTDSTQGTHWYSKHITPSNFKVI